MSQSSNRVRTVAAGNGSYRGNVLSLPSAESTHPSKPGVASSSRVASRAALQGAEVRSVRRFAKGFAQGFAVLALVLGGCSSKTADKPRDTSAENVAVSLSADSSVSDPAVAAPVTPATPEDSEVVVAATSEEQGVAAPDGSAPVVVNQITGDDLVPVVFDFPATPRPIKEVDRPIAADTKRLALKVSGLSYHGVVCGFSIKGTRPESPAIIRMTGTKADGTGFDSGPISVAWTLTEPPEVSSGGSDNNGWNFLSDANPNRSGPGWVVSLGGVTPNVAGAVPESAACSLELGVGFFAPVNGPIGYWAGFARN